METEITIPWRNTQATFNRKEKYLQQNKIHYHNNKTCYYHTGFTAKEQRRLDTRVCTQIFPVHFLFSGIYSFRTFSERIFYFTGASQSCLGEWRNFGVYSIRTENKTNLSSQRLALISIHFPAISYLTCGLSEKKYTFLGQHYANVPV